MKEKISETVLFEVVNAGKEKEFVALLQNSTALTEEDIKAIQIMIAYFRLLRYPALKKAMQESLSAELYKEFNMRGE